MRATVLPSRYRTEEMLGGSKSCAIACMILFCPGCATQTSMDQRLLEMRRQVEVGCMRTLMERGMPLRYFSESMIRHCRHVSRRTVR